MKHPRIVAALATATFLVVLYWPGRLPWEHKWVRPDYYP